MSRRDIRYLSILNVSIFCLVFFLVIPVGTYLYFVSDLGSEETIMNRKNAGVIFLDRKNRPFFSFYEARNTTIVPLSIIPLFMQQAVIASEDRDFYHHPGFSLRSIIRALFSDVTHKDLIQGGSTITQQLVKNALLTPRKDFVRKYQEVILAAEIERRYTKAQILEMYLNSVYFGAGTFGVEDAAERYFGIPAQRLDLAQSAFLTGLLPAPSRFSPFGGDVNLAYFHEKTVLDEMFDQHFITVQQKQSAEDETFLFNQQEYDMNVVAPHFAIMVRDELIKNYGEEFIARSGFRVQTTLDLDWQRFAESTVRRQVAHLAADRVSNGSAVVLDPQTGEIRALVGSVDWFNEDFGKVNIALSTRPPGSSFKPIIYSAAFEKRMITPAKSGFWS